MISRAIPVVLLLLGLFIEGCADTQERRSTFAVVDSAGVELIYNPLTGILSDELLRDIREDVRIGTVFGEEPYMFDYIARIAEGPGDTIYALDQGTCTIRVFSPDGTFIREFGGEGDGPGELRPPLWMYRGGDILAVFGGSGTSFFSLSGEFLRRWPLRTVEGRNPSPIGRTNQGWVALIVKMNRTDSTVPGGVYQDTLQIVEFDQVSGEPGRNLFSYLNARMVGYPRGYGQGELSAYWPLFEPRPQLIVGQDGLMYYSATLPYMIDVYDGTGRLLKRIHGPHEPLPVTEALVDSYCEKVRSMFEERYPDRPGTEAEMRRTTEGRRKLVHVKVLPPIGGFLVGRDGSLWVQRLDLVEDPARMELERTFGAGRGMQRMTFLYWDLFHSSGAFLGRVKIPPRFTPHTVTLNTVLGVERNPEGVQFIVRYRISTLEAIEHAIADSRLVR